MNKRSFFPNLRASALAGVAVAGLLTGSIAAMAQVAGSSQTTTDANGQQHETPPITATTPDKKDKVVQSKDTKKELRKEKSVKPADMPDQKLPDKVLYDKAINATNPGPSDAPRP